MNTDKYNRSAVLLCPTCGNSRLETQGEENDTIRCPSCNRTMTKDELIHENSESIDANIDEMKEEFVSDIKEMLRKTIKNNKNIRIK